MLRRLLLIGSLPGLLVIGTRISHLFAQTAPERPQPSLAEIKQAIVAATGYDAAAIELTASMVQFVVTVVNSKLIATSGKEREVEAGRIVAAIASAIADNASFRTVKAIHVDYVSREQDSTHSRTVDGIDFRKNPQGTFEHHIT